MRDSTIGRNYAEALFELAGKAKARTAWGKRLDELAGALEEDDTLRKFLESPRISADQKNAVLTNALGDRVPEMFLKFLRALVKNRRQMLLPVVASEYTALLDESENRMHVRVTVAREADAKTEKAIAKELSRVYGKEVVPHLTVNPAIVGGMIARVGDSVIDGSVRRRLRKLREKMVG